MSKADPTISEREMRYRKKQLESGMVMVRTWVPKDRRIELLEFAKKLKSESQPDHE